ncbi:esterase EstB [Variibacter gotjawalensis]|uniref:Esterase EstB n=1 Tax=Variibacter gotjawalensis TaxID=1333996 RepID=A0A0S3PTS9_9BRAD|nr:serine hydrolase domain-containing protein [Variibacter gotjawalensis]NIK49546.1 CubicO group peptidase (beta-lactamase class C family) [Variibacter gotjawalensis]RZS51397.1 CubicO group peptidase (beta-lactamase class C family) [Variibacter gotjawalensis]BAT59230.1 esterase EstB [Variibacter gotjawalensis]
MKLPVVRLLMASAALLALTPAAQAQDAQGISRERLARIAPVMKQEVEKGTFPGAITLIARNGKVVHVETHGFQDAAKTKPMKRDTIFRMASMTKPMTTAAAMMLVEQGVFKIEDPISNLLPELKDLKVETKKADGSTEDVTARPITIQDLMRHTSGLFYAAPPPSERLAKAYNDANIEARQEDIAADEMLKRLGGIPLAHQPGTNFHYSISTDILGLLLERATKKPLSQVLDEMLIKPLGMKDTAFWVPAEKKARLAEVTDGDPAKPGSLRYCLDEATIKKSYFKGGAGLCSTIDDYYKFAQMVANGGEFGGKRYLSKKTVEFMLSDHLIGMGGSTSASTGPGYGFGLGFAVRRQDGFGWTAGSTGDAMWAGAFGTMFTIDPREKIVAIQLSQGATTRIRSRMLFKNLVYGAIVK